MEHDVGDFAPLFADAGFLDAVAGLNEAVSAPGDMIEGNIFYTNLETLKEVPIDQLQAHFRKGYPAAIKGRNRFLEIGFNAGHSALTYLYVNPEGVYHGVDLANRPYTHEAAKYMSSKFGNRFHLVVGDSTIVLPQMITDKVEPFDAIHVDGGHTYDVAYADIINGYNLLRDDGIILVDDIPAPEVGKAVEDALKAGLLIPHSLHVQFLGLFQAYLQKAV